MRKVQLVDLDGCISDDRWRRSMILPGAVDMPINKGFAVYHSQCWRDEATNLGELLPDCDHVILTARPVMYMYMTQRWLNQNKIYPTVILHRNNEDKRPSYMVKRDQLQWVLNSNNLYNVHLEDIALAIDDRDDILGMYSNYGISTKLVRIGEEEHNEGR